MGGHSNARPEVIIFCKSHPSTGRERLIRSHSSARFCLELSGNLN